MKFTKYNNAKRLASRVNVSFYDARSHMCGGNFIYGYHWEFVDSRVVPFCDEAKNWAIRGGFTISNIATIHN